MKRIRTEDAVGKVLCHDMTQIIRGVRKDAIFRKGHIVREEDIPKLLSIGKDHIYIWEPEAGLLHENDAAEILCRICQGDHIKRSEVKEGKIQLYADCDGLLKIRRDRLRQVNCLGNMMIATRHGDTAVQKGDALGGTRIIPLAIEESKMKEAQELAGPEPLLYIMPFYAKKVGVVTTGNEVFYGRIEDAFTPVIQEKLAEYQAEIAIHTVLGDDHTKITQCCLEMIESGVDMVICTGGMSVDPDDRTPLAIKNTGAQIISYGAPVLPGAMFLMAYFSHQKRMVPIMGLPGCVMYSKRTIFDLILPRVVAEDPITADGLSALGEGGMCLDCPVCTYPNCGFGKGL